MDCRVPQGPPQVAAASVPLGNVSGMPRARSRSAVSREALDRKCLGDVSCRALDHSLPHDARLNTSRCEHTARSQRGGGSLASKCHVGARNKESA